jgi:hypothetical protein
VAEQRKLNQNMYARIFVMLTAEPCTTHDLVEETGIHLVTAQRLMRCFNRYKLVHVCGWEKDVKGRDCTQIYKFGKGKDKPRHRMTDAERTERYRNKKKMMALTNVLHGAHA